MNLENALANILYAQSAAGKKETGAKAAASTGGGFMDFVGKYQLPLSMGMGLLGDITSWLANRGRRKAAVRDFGQAKQELGGMVGTDVFNPFAIAAQASAGIEAKRGQYGAEIDKVANLDAGSGRGALAESMLGQFQGQLAELITMNATQKAARDERIRTIFAELAARRMSEVGA